MKRLLSNETVTLRALEPTDLDTLYRWENDTTLWAVSDTVAPYSREALWHYLQEYTGDIYAQRQLRLMVTLTSDGSPVGTIDFFNFDPLNNRAEMGLFIAAEHRGKGLGRQALDLLTAYARDHIGLRQLYVFIGLDNKACLDLYVACWERTARRFRGNTDVIYGYDLLNEPIRPVRFEGDTSLEHCVPRLAEFYEKAIARIRATGDNHIVTLEGHHWATAPDMICLSGLERG